MRLAVFVFSIILIVSTTYAHAIAFVPAVVGGLVRTAGGKVIKVASKKGVLATAGVAVGLYCKKNKEKCKDILGDTAEYFFDDDDDGKCKNRVIYLGTNTGEKSSLQAAATAEANYYIDYHNANYSSRATFVGIDDDYDVWSNNLKTLDDDIQRALKQQNSSGIVLNRSLQGKYIQNTTHSDGRTHQNKGYFGIQVIVKAGCDEANQTMSDNKKEQQIQKIVQNLSDDDITYIINNYGDQLNIDKYCTTPNACIELDEQFGDEAMNNKHKYDIDRINKDNCEVRNNKIVSCDKAKKDTDDDDNDTTNDTKPKDGDDGDDDTKPKDKDKPIKCDSSPFHKKVCDFIDWYYSDEYNQSDTKIDVQDDTPKPTNTNIDFGGSCPASYVVSYRLDFGFLGSHDLEFTLLDTPRLCAFLSDWINPIMMFLGPLHAVYIIGKRDE